MQMHDKAAVSTDLNARIRRLEEDLECLCAAVRPFAGAVFNDNGDVTLSTGHLTTADWANLRRTYLNADR